MTISDQKLQRTFHKSLIKNILSIEKRALSLSVMSDKEYIVLKAITIRVAYID